MSNYHLKYTHTNPVYNMWGYQENNLNHPKNVSSRFIIQKQVVCFFFLIVMMAATTAQGQIKIDALGRVIAGTNTLPSFDPDTALTLSLQGRKATTNYGGTKLGFGDFGAWGHMGWNVFIGEYGNSDSDILWLHGKKGIRMTANDGNTVIGEFYCDESSRVVIRTRVRTGGITISSDDVNKYNLVPLSNVMPRLKGLNCKSYTYIFPQNYTEGDEPQGNGYCGTTICQSDKERADSARLAHINAIRAAGTVNNGFLTSELESLFPEVVETDASGHKFIDYASLLPIVVTAIQEQQVKIETMQLSVEVLRNQLVECCQGRSRMNDSVDSDSDDSDTTKSSARNDNGEHASQQPVLYQNTPNPFTQATSIEYYIPIHATSATMHVFTLNGVLMQSLPITAFGHGQITVDASSLAAGMYIYSLVVDGQIVDSKRMILTE